MNGVRNGGEKQEKKSSIATRETVGMTLLLFSAIIFFIAVTGKLIFGDIGVAITSFFIGLAGFFIYPLLLISIYFALVLVSGKKLIAAKWIVRIVLLLVSVFFIVHTATAERFFGNGYGSYLSGCWSAASTGAAKGTGGGVLFGLLGYVFRYLLSAPGAYIIFSLLTLLSLFFIFTATPLWKGFRALRRSDNKRGKEPEAASEPQPRPVEVPYSAVYTPAVSAESTAMQTAREAWELREKQRLEEEARAAREREGRYRSERDEYKKNFRNNLMYSDPETFGGRRSDEPQRQQPVTPQEPAPSTQSPRGGTPERYSAQFGKQAETPREPMPRSVDEQFLFDDAINYTQQPTYRAPRETSAPSPAPERLPAEEEVGVEKLPAYDVPDDVDPYPVRPAEEGAYFDDPYTVQGGDSYADELPQDDPLPSGGLEETVRGEYVAPAPIEEYPRERYERDRDREYLDDGLEDSPLDEGKSAVLPELFPNPEEEDTTRAVGFGDRRGEEEFGRGNERGEDRRAASRLFDDDELDEPVDRSRDILGREDGRDIGRSVDEGRAPKPAPKPKRRKPYVKPSIDGLSADSGQSTVSDEEVKENMTRIVEALKAYSKIEVVPVFELRGPSVTQYNVRLPLGATVSSIDRYETEVAMYLQVDAVSIYPNPTKNTVAIDVRNKTAATVGIRSIMESPEYQHSKPGSLVFAIGKQIDGSIMCGDICKMVHILMGGTTGSGKSVMLNTMITSLICKYSPEELRLVLIDPKQVEFSKYAGLPHLIINEIINDASRAELAFKWLVAEMERRYTLINESGATDINEYNEFLPAGGEKLPKIVAIVDEFADLMATAGKEMEEHIKRITQKARAAGIHLVITTQRPDKDVVTGIIKSNLPTRISFRVQQQINSRIILDMNGAEKLLGNGDMYYLSSKGELFRVQGAFISNREVRAIVSEIKEKNEAYYDSSMSDFINKNKNSGGGADIGIEADETFIRALKLVIEKNSASISLIQRGLRVGYNHAGKIIEWMEANDYVSAFQGAKAREVKLTMEEFHRLYPDY